MANILHRLSFVFRGPIFVFRSPNHLSAPPPAPPAPAPLVEIGSVNIVFSGNFNNYFAFPLAADCKMTSELSQALESAILGDVVGGKDSGPSATAAKMMLEPEKSSGKTS